MPRNSMMLKKETQKMEIHNEYFIFNAYMFWFRVILDLKNQGLLFPLPILIEESSMVPELSDPTFIFS